MKDFVKAKAFFKKVVNSKVAKAALRAVLRAVLRFALEALFEGAVDGLFGDDGDDPPVDTNASHSAKECDMRQHSHRACSIRNNRYQRSRVNPRARAAVKPHMISLPYGVPASWQSLPRSERRYAS